MDPGHFLFGGLDIGTSSIKLSVYSETGRLVFEQVYKYPTYHPEPACAEQSPQDWISGVLTLFSEMKTRLGQRCDLLAAIGVSAHAPTLVPIGPDGQPMLARVPIWCDESASKYLNRLVERVGPDFAGLGLPGASFPVKLYRFTNEKPDIAAKTSIISGIKSFLFHWLTGKYATDPSSEPGNDEGWDRIIRECGWSIEKLAPVLGPTQQVGFLQEEVCKMVGLPGTIPIISGLNDGGSSTLSCGAYYPGDAVIELATNGVVYLVADHPIPAEERLNRAFFCWKYVDDAWIIGGQTKCGASAYEWASKFFGGKNPVSVQEMIDTAQSSPPGANGVSFFPYLNGRGTPSEDPYANASLLGITIRSSASDAYRAVIEGVAFGLREIIEYLEGSGFLLKRVWITGGGAQHTFCRQMMADVLDKTLIFSETKATLGAAILASIGVSEEKNIPMALARMLSSSAALVQSDNTRAAEYDELYQRYMGLRNRVYES